MTYILDEARAGLDSLDRASTDMGLTPDQIDTIQMYAEGMSHGDLVDCIQIAIRTGFNAGYHRGMMTRRHSTGRSTATLELVKT